MSVLQSNEIQSEPKEVDQDTTIEKSELALAIENRERKLHEFEVQGFFSLGGKPIHKIAMRVAVKVEEDESLIAAHKRMEELTSGNKEAMADFDLLGDTKLVEILHRVSFRVDEKTKHGHPYQAFPGPSWMKKWFTTDQIAVLMNLYHEVRKFESPMLWDFGADRVMSLADSCARNRHSQVPEALLASATREWLSGAFVILATRWREQKRLLEDHGILSESGSQFADKELNEATGETEEDRPDDAVDPEGSSGDGKVDAPVPESEGES